MSKRNGKPPCEGCRFFCVFVLSADALDIFGWRFAGVFLKDLGKVESVRKTAFV